MDIKISFIVPVYNVEKYIEECIKSLINQNYNDIEVLLINDGSEDRSGQICDEFALKDKRIKVYHQENKGLASARNRGISLAEGDYICFVDSDDFWLPNKLESMVNIIQKEKCDMLMFPINSYYTEKDEYNLFSTIFEQEIFKGNNHDVLKGVLKQNPSFGWCAVWYMIRKDILKEILFLDNYLCEDVEFTFKMWNKVRSVKYYNQPVYAYRRDNTTSITHIAKFKFCEDLVTMMEINISKITDFKIDQELKELLYKNYLDLLSVVLYHYFTYTNEEKKRLKNKIKKISCVFQIKNIAIKNIGFKKLLIIILINSLGINLTGYIWHIKKLIRN